MSNTYSIYETKTQFSALLRRVKTGSELVITEHGRPVARLVPYQSNESLTERLDRLTASGHLLPRAARAARPGPRKPGALKRFFEERE
ncbi:MAG: type II toxin-antitoxin system prevent-host-death family antitoxin [Deltaproteobacteria bacterium]|nr:type II toxin-antitoxin system prevent-host-death family antitoxin [Deltaproteobacteria bacterium]